MSDPKLYERLEELSEAVVRIDTKVSMMVQTLDLAAGDRGFPRCAEMRNEVKNIKEEQNRIRTNETRRNMIVFAAIVSALAALVTAGFGGAGG